MTYFGEQASSHTIFSPKKLRLDFAHFTINLQSVTVEVTKYTPPPDKQSKTPKPSSGAYGSASSDRPYACPYEGCEKAYIHEYKLKLHLRDRHRGHISDENAEVENVQTAKIRNKAGPNQT